MYSFVAEIVNCLNFSWVFYLARSRIPSNLVSTTSTQSRGDLTIALNITSVNLYIDAANCIENEYKKQSLSANLIVTYTYAV